MTSENHCSGVPSVNGVGEKDGLKLQHDVTLPERIASQSVALDSNVLPAAQDRAIVITSTPSAPTAQLDAVTQAQLPSSPNSQNQSTGYLAFIIDSVGDKNVAAHAHRKRKQPLRSKVKEQSRKNPRNQGRGVRQG
jgi:hypothetical protein